MMYKMKYICHLFILFLIIIAVSPVYSQLKDTDIEKIRSIIEKSEADLKAQIEKSEADLKAQIEKSESNLKAQIEKSESNLKTYIDTKIETVNAQIKGVEKSLNFLFGFVIALVGLIGVAIGLPTFLSIIRQKSPPTQEEAQKESSPA